MLLSGLSHFGYMVYLVYCLRLAFLIFTETGTHGRCSTAGFYRKRGATYRKGNAIYTNSTGSFNSFVISPFNLALLVVIQFRNSYFVQQQF